MVTEVHAVSYAQQARGHKFCSKYLTKSSTVIIQTLNPKVTIQYSIAVIEQSSVYKRLHGYLI